MTTTNTFLSISEGTEGSSCKNDEVQDSNEIPSNPEETSNSDMSTQRVIECIDTNVPHEGVRMTQIRKALNATSEKCIMMAKKSLFKRSLKKLVIKKPKIIRHLKNQFQQELQAHISDEINLMFQEEDIVEKMNNLDRMISESPTTDAPMWRPNSNVERSIQPHILSVKIKHKHKLQQFLKEEESETNRLQGILTRKKKHLDSTVNHCKMIVEGLVNEEMDYELAQGFDT